MHRPRIERIHHLAIAVPSLEGALDLWRDALGVLISFDVIFVTAGSLLFPAIVKD